MLDIRSNNNGHINRGGNFYVGILMKQEESGGSRQE